MQTIYTIELLGGARAAVSVAKREYDADVARPTSLRFSIDPNARNMAGTLGTVDGDGMPFTLPDLCAEIMSAASRCIATGETQTVVHGQATPAPSARKINHAAAAKYDAVVNEGGEGYNPHRS